MPYSFPLESATAVVERIDDVPPGARVHRWVLRDDNRQQYEGVLRLDEEPAYIELHWKPNVRGQDQFIGNFRLHLRPLMTGGFVRAERDGHADDEVSVRVHRGDRNVIAIQARDEGPALPIAVVDVTIG